jgi:aspartate/tyrosine/aromatic aminotransferase
MSSAFRRQYQKELQQAREAAVHRRTELVSQLGEDRREDAWLLIQDKHEELHGSGFYSIGQIEEVNAIIAAYTPDEFDAAVALAKGRESAV